MQLLYRCLTAIYVGIYLDSGIGNTVGQVDIYHSQMAMMDMMCNINIDQMLTLLRLSGCPYHLTINLFFLAHKLKLRTELTHPSFF